MDGDASSSPGVAFALLASLSIESVNGRLVLRVFKFKDHCEGGVRNASIWGGEGFLGDGDTDNKFCSRLSAH